MNGTRRQSIAKARGMLEEAKEILETASGEERDFYDAMPENMKSGDKGEQAENAASKLEEAIESLDTIIGDLQEVAE